MNSWSSVCPHGIHFFLGLFYFSFSRISSALIPLANSFLTTLGLGLLCFFSGLGICFRLFCFQRGQLFFSFLQQYLLLFQCILLLFNRFLNGCDLSIQGRNRLLLLCDLGCVVFGDIGFGTVLLPFVLSIGDNLFPF